MGASGLFNTRRRQMAARQHTGAHTGANRVLESVKSPRRVVVPRLLVRLIIPRLSRADTLNPACQTARGEGWGEVDVSRVSNRRLLLLFEATRRARRIARFVSLRRSPYYSASTSLLRLPLFRLV